jgi:hypothetical protein
MMREATQNRGVAAGQGNSGTKTDRERERDSNRDRDSRAHQGGGLKESNSHSIITANAAYRGPSEGDRVNERERERLRNEAISKQKLQQQQQLQQQNVPKGRSMQEESSTDSQQRYPMSRSFEKTDNTYPTGGESDTSRMREKYDSMRSSRHYPPTQKPLDGSSAVTAQTYASPSYHNVEDTRKPAATAINYGAFPSQSSGEGGGGGGGTNSQSKGKRSEVSSAVNYSGSYDNNNNNNSYSMNNNSNSNTNNHSINNNNNYSINSNSNSNN